jgi:transposase-like protein
VATFGRRHSQVNAAEQWPASGTKTIAEICRDLGGISSPTLFNYIPGGRAAAREKYPQLAAEADARSKVSRPRKAVVREPGDKKLGRPPAIAGEKAELAEDLFLKGRTMKEIALALNVNLASVYRYFGLKNREYWEKRREEAQTAKK